MEARNEENSYLTTEYAELSWRGFGKVCRSTTPMKSVISEHKAKSWYAISVFQMLILPYAANSIGRTNHFYWRSIRDKENPNQNQHALNQSQSKRNQEGRKNIAFSKKKWHRPKRVKSFPRRELTVRKPTDHNLRHQEHGRLSHAPGARAGNP